MEVKRNVEEIIEMLQEIQRDALEANGCYYSVNFDFDDKEIRKRITDWLTSDKFEYWV